MEGLFWIPEGDDLDRRLKKEVVMFKDKEKRREYMREYYKKNNKAKTYLYEGVLQEESREIQGYKEEVL